MIIKKPMKTAVSTETSAPSAGTATIADRFKLDASDPSAVKASAGKGTTIAVVAGLLALAVSGILTFVLYQHWEFLRNA